MTWQSQPLDQTKKKHRMTKKYFIWITKIFLISTLDSISRWLPPQPPPLNKYQIKFISRFAVLVVFSEFGFSASPKKRTTFEKYSQTSKPNHYSEKSALKTQSKTKAANRWQKNEDERERELTFYFDVPSAHVIRTRLAKYENEKQQQKPGQRQRE